MTELGIITLPPMRGTQLLVRKGNRTISRRKRLAFAAILVLLLYLFLEALSLCAVRLGDGHWYTWSSAAGDRRKAALAAAGHSAPAFSASTGVIHPYVGYAMPSGWKPDNPNTLYPFAWSEDFTNRPFDGFPSRRPVVQKRSADAILVGIFGGSVAEVFYHQGVHVLLRKLQEHPRFRHKEFVVVCLASGGYKQPQQLMALNYILAQGGELDLLINVDGFNEVALHASGNKQHGVFPIYPRAWFSRVGQIRDSRVLKLYGRAALLETDLRDAANFFSYRPLSFSPTCHLLWSARNRVLEKRLRDARAAIEDSSFEDDVVTTGRGYRPASEQELYEDLVQIWEASSRQMRVLCAANGIRYYHFLQPNQYVEGSKLLNAEELRRAFRDNHPYREGVVRGYPVLRRAGERLAASGECFTDLTDAFVATREQVYLDDCCHFGERGNSIIADRIAEAIIEDQGEE